MTDVTGRAAPRRELKKRSTSDANVRKRRARERRFQAYGVAALGSAIAMLVFLMVTIVGNGYSAFFQHEVALNVDINRDRLNLGPSPDEDALARASYRLVVRDALKAEFDTVSGRRELRTLYGFVSNGADFAVRDAVLANPEIVGTTQQIWIKTSDDIDTLLKGQMSDVARWQPQSAASVTGTTGTVTITAGGQAFATVLEQVKAHLQDVADELAVRQARLESIVEDQKAAVAELTRSNSNPEEAARLVGDIAANEAAAKQLSERIAGLRQRAAAAAGSEVLVADLPSYLVKINGGLVKITEVSAGEAKGEALLPLQRGTPAPQGSWEIVSYLTPEADRRVKDMEIAWITKLQAEDRIEERFNIAFFQNGDSREPEIAGIWGAVVGSFFTLVTTLLISFPIGVLAAVYLEEFAPRNRWTDLIEVNINNLAAVPSIVFGLLGLAVFLNFFGMPRSAPLVGGIVLALMTLPTIIIASRAALKSVPPSIRQAALGMGASRLQTIAHHVLPLAMPGILTGTIIGMAQALGETAPLLMIGMVAFIVDIPGGFTDPATVMPVQIYLWADSPERAFVAKTSAAIMVLLAFLIVMNAIAVVLRKRFENRW